MTYAELAKKIAKMTPKQKQHEVTAFDEMTVEYYPVLQVQTVMDKSKVAPDHSLLTIRVE